MTQADYGLLFEHHPDPAWIYDLETLRFLAVNRAAIAHYGYSAQEFLAMTIADIRPQEDVARLLANVQKVTEGRDPAGTWRHRTKSGDLLRVEIHSEVIDFRGHRAELVIARDITALTAANYLQRIAGRMARLGGWRIELAEGRVIWSQETAAIHGFDSPYHPSLAEALQFYAPEYRARINTLFGACVEQGVPFDAELQIITVQGERRWVRAQGEAELDNRGQVYAVHGAFQDITEQVAMRARAEDLTLRLRSTLENMSDAFFLLDRDFRFVFLNPHAEQLLQRREAELLGQRVWQEFPEAEELLFKERYEYAMASGESVCFVSFYAPLGTWFSVDAYPGPEGLAVYFRDVTENHQRDHQLRLLETAVARQNDILVITEAGDINHPRGPRIVYVNDAFEKLTGYRREETLGNTPRMLQGPETQRGELDRIRRALEADQPVRAELINYTRDGTPFWLELDIAPMADDRGHTSHFVAVQRDITERKVTEQSLHERVKELRCLYQVSSLTANPEAPVDEILGGIVCTLPPALQHNDIAVARLQYDEQDYYSPGWREPVAAWQTVIHQNGRQRGWIEIGYREERRQSSRGEDLFLIEEQDMLQIIAVTIGQMLEQRETAGQLAQSERLGAIGQLTGGVAHDFNNLLTVILGNAEMLKEQLTDQQQLRLLADMTATAAIRGAELTNRLLAFARRQALEPQKVDLNKLMAGMDGLLRRTLSEAIDIELVQGGGLWLAEVDPGQLEVALLNLAINARDAMPEGGRLTLETGNSVLDDDYARGHQEVTPGQYVLLSVSDSGTGMTPAVIARAFEPFYTTKPVGKGSGLGLSMVFGFIKQTGGHVKIYSELGEGTTIKLYLPRASANSIVPDPAVIRPPASGGDEHILAVEDDDLVRQHVVTLLKGLGYRVTSASSGPEALEILHQMADIDLLFTDVIMPGGINGRQLAEQALALRPTLKVLFTSGYTENAIVHHGRLDRGVHLLGKPYRRQDLAEKVRRVLEE